MTLENTWKKDFLDKPFSSLRYSLLSCSPSLFGRIPKFISLRSASSGSFLYWGSFFGRCVNRLFSERRLQLELFETLQLLRFIQFPLNLIPHNLTRMSLRQEHRGSRLRSIPDGYGWISGKSAINKGLKPAFHQKNVRSNSSECKAPILIVNFEYPLPSILSWSFLLVKMPC